MNPSGVMSTASYTAPAMPRPVSSVGKLPRSAPNAATKFPSAEATHTPTKTTTDGTPPWLSGTALSRPSRRGTTDEGRKYNAVIVEYLCGVTSSFGSSRSCSSMTPGASLLKWLHAMTNASNIEHATPLRRCGGIGVGRMTAPPLRTAAPPLRRVIVFREKARAVELHFSSSCGLWSSWFDPIFAVNAYQTFCFDDIVYVWRNK